ncbi:MAG: DUF2777 domain-containing protein [Bacillus sp. (in: Bacteria)]|nr:DUF2777 domain-containing protein [Bacillus sp. (in: firmicutes)]
MDRKQARDLIGEKILLNEGNQGKYIAVLKEMITEANKPWRAVLCIVGVFEYPSINLEELELTKPFLQNNEIYECSGQKVEFLDDHFDKLTYDESLTLALKEKWDEINQINEESEIILSLIQQELRRLKSEYLIFEDNYVYYKLVKRGRSFHIYDEEKRETVSLEGCPFEFESKVDGKWIPVQYVKGATFQLADGEKIDLSHGASLRLNKTQFDPYQILLNELDEPSIHALEKGLKRFGLGHEHCVFCHNSLLLQLLNSFNKDSLTGVNFISYANSKNQFVVQHHYERTYKEYEDDITFDRFEFTSDTGERVLTSYATQFSQDK